MHLGGKAQLSGGGRKRDAAPLGRRRGRVQGEPATSGWALPERANSHRVSEAHHSWVQRVDENRTGGRKGSVSRAALSESPPTHLSNNWAINALLHRMFPVSKDL